MKLCAVRNGWLDWQFSLSRVSPVMTTAAAVLVFQTTSAEKMSLDAKLLTTVFQVSKNYNLAVITHTLTLIRNLLAICISGLQCMIDAEQPYCADVDECNDEREDFNKLDVRTPFSTSSLLLTVVHCTIHINDRKHYNSNTFRCAGITRTASTQWAPSAASARMDSTAGRQTADASISTSEIQCADCIKFLLDFWIFFTTKPWPAFGRRA